MKNKWHGEIPKRCDICGREIKKVFIDGRTDMGAWANMCEHCHRERGVGLGVGKGQKYTMKVIKGGGTEWIKVKKTH